MPTIPERYQARFGYCPPAIADPPRPGLGLVVVMPCFDEPDLTGALESLLACRLPSCPVEVIVVVNAPEDSPPEVAARTQSLREEAEGWMAAHQSERLRFHLLHHPALPARQAGVGLARKIGMDEAAYRLFRAGSPQGIIAGYDADCRCEPTYLREMDGYFHGRPAISAASVYFEHPLDGGGDARLAEAIVSYELFLRYFAAGLRLAAYPYPHQTLGSCMAVRAGGYFAAGGMNRRQAGEDFHFLTKFMQPGRFGEILKTTVFPSGRVSHRVPFGTGRAINDFLAGAGPTRATYPVDVFQDLRGLVGRVARLYRTPPGEVEALLNGLPPALAAFLSQAGFAERLGEMQRNSASPRTFEGRFFQWLDRFRVLKFVRFATGGYYPPEPVEVAAAKLLALREGVEVEPAGKASPLALLHHFRAEERDGAPPKETKERG